MTTRKDAREAGVTMIELIIGMGIGLMVVVLAVGVLVNTLRSQVAVTASTKAATQGQNISDLIDEAVRTATAVKATATRLDVHTGTGCQAFAVVGGAVRHSTSTGAIGTASAAWPALADSISQVGSTPYFSAVTGGVGYSFRLQGADGAVDIVSSADQRVTGGSGAPCF